MIHKYKHKHRSTVVATVRSRDGRTYHRMANGMLVRAPVAGDASHTTGGAK